jgi:predicted Ser/Thr protein kinase
MQFSYSILLLQHPRRKLLKKGAEADIFLTDWYGKRAIAKVRTIKAYRHRSLDLDIRRRRTIREAQMLSGVKLIGSFKEYYPRGSYNIKFPIGG